MLLSGSEIYIKNIENLTRSIKLGSKKPSEVGTQISGLFERLKPLNPGMADELMDKYKAAVSDWKTKNENK
jgi:hypothetical protein